MSWRDLGPRRVSSFATISALRVVVVHSVALGKHISVVLNAPSKPTFYFVRDLGLLVQSIKVLEKIGMRLLRLFIYPPPLHVLCLSINAQASLGYGGGVKLVVEAAIPRPLTKGGESSPSASLALNHVLYCCPT